MAEAKHSLTYFISGVMLGNAAQLQDADKDMASQDYRKRMLEIIKRDDPIANVIDPLEFVKARAAERGMTIEDFNLDTELVRENFFKVVELAAKSDVVISNLPVASMGSAAEIWEARKAGKLVLTISPLKDNWLLRSVTSHNFVDLDDFDANFKQFMSGR